MAIIKKFTGFTDKFRKLGRQDVKNATQKSINFFKNKVQDEFGRLKQNHGNRWAIRNMKGADRQMKGALNPENFPMVGHMYHFLYDPKWKEELPYYDTFPLVMPMSYTTNGFLGLNFHYLPPLMRAKLFDALLSIKNHTVYRGGDQEYINLSYEALKGMSNTPYAPTIKRYLWSHVKSNFAHIDSDEWESILFLPSEKFKKASKREVWNDSRRKR